MTISNSSRSTTRVRQAADLVGVKLTDGVEFDFYGERHSRRWNRGGRLVVVAQPGGVPDAVWQRLPVAGEYTGNLDNGGEDIDLRTEPARDLHASCMATAIRGPCGRMERERRWN